MMKINWKLSVAAAWLVLVSLTAYAEEKSAGNQPMVPAAFSRQEEASVRPEAYAAYLQAYDDYKNARSSPDALTKNAYFAKAINGISQLTRENPGYLEAYLLGASVYRSKGGISFASRYFEAARKLGEERIARNPADPKARLQYAIICYTGEANYQPDYQAYQQLALEQAQEILHLNQENTAAAVKISGTNKALVTGGPLSTGKAADTGLSPSTGKTPVPVKLPVAGTAGNSGLDVSGPKSRQLLWKFLAAIIVQDVQAEALYGAELEKENGAAGLFWQQELKPYRELVQNGRWFWPVINREQAEKEFLLYMLSVLE